MQTKKFGIIPIPFANRNQIKLYNITLVSKYKSNPILLWQLFDNEIIYHNHSMVIVLTRNREVIT